MNSKTKPQAPEKNDSKVWPYQKALLITSLVVGGVAVGALGSYVVFFAFLMEYPLSTDPSIWGAFGDFVGGLLNPVIAFAAFVWLARSVHIQQKELGDTRKALADATIAQQEQAEHADNTAKLEAIKMEFQFINQQIEYLQQCHTNDAREREERISKGYGTASYQHLDESIGRLQDTLKELEDKQRTLVEEAYELAGFGVNLIPQTEDR